MYQVNPLLAKLLAKENLTVEHGNYQTAWFDVKNRVLGLPIWKDQGKDVYDLLVGHEVGHALYTPLEGIHSSNEEIKGCPRSYINVVEDARIEKMIRNSYPGLIRSFKRGYKALFESGLFGKDHDFYTMKLIDKINLKSKLSNLIDVPFNDEELELYNETMNTKTFSDVCVVVKKILAYSQEQQDMLEQSSSDSTDNDQSSDEMGHDDQPSTGSDESEDGEESEEKTETDLDNESPAQNENGNQSDTDQLNDEEGDNDAGDLKSPMASNSPIHNDDEELSETDELFRSNEKELLDLNEDGSQTTFVSDYNKSEAEQMVIPYSKLSAARDKKVGNPNNTWKQVETQYNLRSECNAYIKDIKKAVRPAVKEFEMKKAAYQWQRSSTSKTGSINVNKLYSYKYDEDIFARVTQMADAKNHGMMLLIDYSGSMNNIIGNVIQQTLHLITFCKAVNIPFAVYAFTSIGRQYEDHITTRANVMHHDNLAMVELINSDLKKKDYEEALYNLTLRVATAGLILKDVDQSQIRWRLDYRQYVSDYEEFGSTPLNQALMVSNHLAKSFINRHQIQKFNFVTITDGDANQIRMSNSRFMGEGQNINSIPAPAGFASNYSNIKIQIGNKVITAKKDQITEALMTNIRNSLNANTMGFFIADSNHRFKHRGVRTIMKTNKDEWIDRSKVASQINKEYNKNKCVEFNSVYGYNKYYLVKGTKNALNTENDEFNPETTKAIGKDFKKYSKSKKTNKVLMQKIGSAVA